MVGLRGLENVDFEVVPYTLSLIDAGMLACIAELHGGPACFVKALNL